MREASFDRLYKAYTALRGTPLLRDAALLSLLSATFCRYLADKNYEEMAIVLGTTTDYPTAEARQAAVDEPIYEPDAPDAPDAPQPPPVVRSLSTQLLNEDAIEDALVEADVPTLRALKGVSTAWRGRARRTRGSTRVPSSS